MRPINRFLLSLTLVLATLAPAAAAVPSIVIDGARLPADVPALVSGDHVLVPLRGVFERLGARVSYDASSQTAAAALGGTLVQVAVGSRTAWVNGERRLLDVGAREVAGRIMIPLRFVAQSLGVRVDYDGPSDTVVIVSGLKPGSFAAMTSGPDLAAAPKQAPAVQDERPSDGSLIGSQYPSIYARFAGGTSAVNPSSVRISVDGQDVTGSSTISSAYVSYTPTTALRSGQHSVAISGTADDGTPFSSSWSFRVDEGTSSDYTVGTYGGGGLGFAGGGFDGFGFPSHGFRRFGFFPPGFSVFTPGPLFFVSGNIIEVIFVSQFFPFGNAFFTISGFPGVFALTPWQGCPGFFWGFARVPFGMTSHNAIIAARFTTPSGHKVVVRSTAPMQIEGQRRSLPADIRYAVLPHLVNRPNTPRHAVFFERVAPRTIQAIRPGNIAGGTLPTQPGGVHAVHLAPVITHPVPNGPKGPLLQPPLVHPVPGFMRPLPPAMHAQPVVRPLPIVIHPVIRPLPVMPRPGPVAPGGGMQRFPQWQQFERPSRPVVPNAPAPKPK